MKFEIKNIDPWSAARAGLLETSHGQIETPIFMPVATQAVLRGVDTSVVETLDFQILLANTFHLLLRPGPELFQKFGGIHNFMHWKNSVLTDSGGFQIFSLSKSLVLSEEGARFRSYVNGDEILLTPERSIEMQTAIGSDIMMVLDHCINSTSDRSATLAALELTTRWARRSFKARSRDSKQALFGIVQGACYTDLRRESAKQITEIPFDGFALGGLAVGETKSEREDMVEFTAPLLPSDKPRYLMGVGTPIDLLEAVKRGMDMFDCILPTSLAHQGVCFTSQGKIDLRRTTYRTSEDKLDPACSCSTCQRFSRAYLHHLKRADEHVGHQLLSVHNLTFYRSLMRNMRAAIMSGTFKDFYESIKPSLLESDTVNPGKAPAPRSDPALRLGNYEVSVTENEKIRDRLGKPTKYGSIRQLSSGEIMHSVLEPVVESKLLYIDQSELIASTQSQAADSSNSPLIIWDVGLGAATNAMVAILELEKLESVQRPIEIISFENDLDPLRLALKHPGLFPQLRHKAPHSILESGEWNSNQHQLRWRLINRDFKKFLSDEVSSAPTPDIIWYDPFSFKVDTDLWTYETFLALHNLSQSKQARLFTYTASTAVRGALLAAGWYVAFGLPTGKKAETTIAFSQPVKAPGVKNLLSTQWIQRWERSDAKQPLGSTDSKLLDAIRGHPQFSISA